MNKTVPLCNVWLAGVNEQLDEWADEITVHARDFSNHVRYTTLGALLDDTEWCKNGREEVFIWTARAIAATQQGLTMDFLMGAYRGCLACQHDGHPECSACGYCDDHDCGGGCADADLARHYEACDAAQGEER